VQLTNTGSSTIDGWTLRWHFGAGQQVTSLWGGTLGTSTGGDVTVTNPSWNTKIPAGSTISVGFIATSTGTNPAPTGFTVNGGVCATA